MRSQEMASTGQPHARTHADARTRTHTHTRLTAPEPYHVAQEAREPVGPAAQAAHELQPLRSSHPVPHHGAADGRGEDGEAKHDAQGHAALADALQAAGGGRAGIRG